MKQTNNLGLILLPLLLISGIITGCQNSFDACMDYCKTKYDNFTYCNKSSIGLAEAIDNLDKCQIEQNSFCFEKCKGE